MSPAIIAALRSLVDAIACEPSPQTSPDALVGLADCGVELAAAKRLVREGRLRTARLGRRRYVRRSELLAAFDAIAAEQAAKAEPVKVGGYSSIVSLAARRGAP